MNYSKSNVEPPEGFKEGVREGNFVFNLAPEMSDHDPGAAMFLLSWLWIPEPFCLQEEAWPGTRGPLMLAEQRSLCPLSFPPPPHASSQPGSGYSSNAGLHSWPQGQNRAALWLRAWA